jgi:hypothetical protein
LVDIVVTDENLHAVSLRSRGLMGPAAGGSMAAGYWRTDMKDAGAGGIRGTNQRRFSKSCLPMAPITEAIARLASIAMIEVCPQLNPIPMPTRKKLNSDPSAKMTHLVSSNSRAVLPLNEALGHSIGKIAATTGG